MKVLLALVVALGALMVPVSARANVPFECGAAALRPSFGSLDAAMSHEFGKLRLTNVSTGPCWVQGYGGLSFVKHRGGAQVGAPASRTPSSRPKVILAPGASVVSEVEITSVGPYDPALCRPTKVAGFRVFVPDATDAKFVRFPFTTCANRSLGMLQHKAYRRA